MRISGHCVERNLQSRDDKIRLQFVNWISKERTVVFTKLRYTYVKWNHTELVPILNIVCSFTSLRTSNAYMRKDADPERKLQTPHQQR